MFTKQHEAAARTIFPSIYAVHIGQLFRQMFLYSIGMRIVRNASPIAGEVKSVYKAPSVQNKGKTLIVYFSQTGNTDGLAKIIQEMTGADIFRIERKTPYSATSNSQSLYAEALNEYRSSAEPELKAYPEDKGIDINQYDTIMLGYCNWWASIPASIRTFLKHYDLSSKTIIPLLQHGRWSFRSDNKRSCKARSRHRNQRRSLCNILFLRQRRN